MKHKRVVIKVTGSLFDLDKNKELRELFKLVNFVKEIVLKNKMKIFMIVGGGRHLRDYLSILRRRGVNESMLDRVGIELTRVNALILSSLLGDICCGVIPKSIDEALILQNFGSVVVMGGLIPGFSTNAVSALIAEAINSDLLIIMSKAGALYDKDPEKFKDAKPIKKAKIDDVRRILSQYWSKAGYYPLLDRTAIEIINRSKIPTVIIPPTVESLKKTLEGEYIGTLIVFDNR